MNCSFYLALDRLPISLVAAIEFVGTIGVALFGLRSGRNLAALAIAVAGALMLIDVKWSSDPRACAWAFLNGALFVGYIVLGHRLARAGASNGVANLGAAMAIAFLFVLPFGFAEAIAAFSSPMLLAAAVGVGICSSVIPYICDQLAMSRLPRASFALLLSLLPVTATIIGIVVLAQIPSAADILGIALVMLGVAIHKPAPEPATEPVVSETDKPVFDNQLGIRKNSRTLFVARIKARALACPAIKMSNGPMGCSSFRDGERDLSCFRRIRARRNRARDERNEIFQCARLLRAGSAFHAPLPIRKARSTDDDDIGSLVSLQPSPRGRRTVLQKRDADIGVESNLHGR